MNVEIQIGTNFFTTVKKLTAVNVTIKPEYNAVCIVKEKKDSDYIYQFPYSDVLCVSDSLIMFTTKCDKTVSFKLTNVGLGKLMKSKITLPPITKIYLVVDYENLLKGKLP